MRDQEKLVTPDAMSLFQKTGTLSLTLEATSSPELNYLDSPSPNKKLAISPREEAALLASPEEPPQQEEPMETEDQAPTLLVPPPPTTQEEKKSSPVARVPPQPPVQKVNLAFDSHFHLDRLCKELHLELREQSIFHLWEDQPPLVPVTLAGGCMIFCDPKGYDRVPRGWDKKWKIGIGVHPKKIRDLTAERMHQLKKILPRCQAFGEIGLDFSDP
jgi:hypothetical protein